MSALKHGLFRVGFMLCDRCSINTSCERFQAASQCVLEKLAFEQLVKELTKQYELDMVADRILAERTAMYLIRVSRAEAYEATVGITDKSVFWGTYISRLDNTLRGLLNDLAVSRAKRKGLEKAEQLMVNIEDLLESLANTEFMKKQTVRMEPRFVGKAARTAGRATITMYMVPRPRPTGIFHDLLDKWRMEKPRLLKKLAARQK